MNLESVHKMNLFCLPFAGGSAYAYKNLVKYAPDFLEVESLELPGRGTRTKEKLLTKIDALVDDIFLQIESKLSKPYAIYGHSMGALLGYLVTKKIIDLGYPQPIHLFFTGCWGPSVEIERSRHLLPYDLFIEKLRELDGSPEEVLNDPVLMKYFEPIIRADFQTVDEYRYKETTPFSIPISVIIGLNEKITYEQAFTWQKETTEKIEVRQFPGKHFFIFQYPHEVMKTLTSKLLNISKAAYPLSRKFGSEYE